MSKNDNRYKDVNRVDVNDIDELDELETPKFEKFHPKKKIGKQHIKTPRDNSKDT